MILKSVYVNKCGIMSRKALEQLNVLKKTAVKSYFFLPRKLNLIIGLTSFYPMAGIQN